MGDVASADSGVGGAISKSSVDETGHEVVA